MTFRQLGVALLLLAVASPLVYGQGPGGRRGPGGPGGPGGFGRGGFGRGGGMFGVSLISLVDIEAVQKELDLVEEQLASVRELTEKMQSEGRGERPNFEEMTDEEREQWMTERRKRAEEQAAKAKTELANILLEDQMARLNQIYLQVAGTRALSDADVIAALEISEEQKAAIESAREEASAKMQEQMQELFQGGGDDEDRDARRAKMEELRKSSEEEVLAQLTEAQRTKLTEMKGPAFEMPADAFRGRGGFGGGRGNRGGQGRPQRPGN